MRLEPEGSILMLQLTPRESSVNPSDVAILGMLVMLAAATDGPVRRILKFASRHIGESEQAAEAISEAPTQVRVRSTHRKTSRGKRS